MFKFLSGLLASISSIFISDASKPATPPLNTAIIAYQETYYAPVVTNPENFPWVKSTDIVSVVVAPRPITMPPTPPTPAPPVLITPVPVTPVVSVKPQDIYLANPEPVISWLNMNLTLRGASNDIDNPRTLPEVTIDREYWRIEVFAYWAADVIPPKPDVEKDYFKLEVYEKGTDKLIYTMTSGTDNAMHKFQSFGKAGVYYFKVYTKNPSKWEMSFVVSPKIAQ